MSNKTKSIPASIKRLWDCIWFQGQNAYDLGIARALGCLLILMFALPPLELTIALDAVNGTASTERPAVFLLRMLVGDYATHSSIWLSVHWITVISGIFSVLGLGTKVSIRIFAIGYLLLVSHMWSFGELHHPRIAPVWFLLVLFFAPCGDCFSLDAFIRNRGANSSKQLLSEPQSYAWAGNLFLALIAYAYSYSGLWKLLYQGGVEWMNGLTSRYYLFVDDVSYMCSPDRNSIYYWLYDSLPALRLTGIVTIAFEVFFPIALFFRPLRMPFLFIAFAFHAGNYALRGENGIFLLYPILAMLLITRFDVSPSAVVNKTRKHSSSSNESL
ncbi:HTTM domain-containing protein [Rubritalea marina]|uniref:HTTM domain-containing protein n=1 Tax=Rubritalea marina TaxID=361055 RepID=UPI000361052E|nr:HTTM domain-containing protein [Rubritalea marina]